MNGHPTVSMAMWSVATAGTAEAGDTTICSLTSAPAAYSGKMVSVLATVTSDYHGTFLQERRCKEFLLLVQSGRSAMTPAIRLKTDTAYKRFEAALHDYPAGSTRDERRRTSPPRGAMATRSRKCVGSSVTVTPAGPWTSAPSPSSKWEWADHPFKGLPTHSARRARCRLPIMPPGHSGANLERYLRANPIAAPWASAQRRGKARPAVSRRPEPPC